MIEERTSTTYRVACDSCGDTGPPHPIRREAIALAIEAGFDCVARWNGLEHYTIHLCGDCYREQMEASDE